MSANAGWCTIESDPAVFTEMLKKFGVKGVAAEEIISLDADSLKMLTQPIYGLIMLFKWTGKEASSGEKAVIEDANHLYFAKQVVQNACATQAIVNIMLNLDEKNSNSDNRIELGESLTNLKEFSAEMDPELRGDMLGQSEVLKTVHNGFARSSAFSFEEKQKQDKDDDVYHFIGYVWKDGVVWELDGLQKGPILIEPCDEDAWLDTAANAIRSRMEEVSKVDTNGSGQGISFSLMALTGDKVAQLQARLASLKASGGDTGVVEVELSDAVEERQRGELENVRRRHNYVPTVVKLLRALAEKGKLRGIVDAAKERKAAEKK